MVDLEFDDKNYFTFYAAAEYNGKLYISDPDNRGLLVYDLDTKEINVKNIFPLKSDIFTYLSIHFTIWITAKFDKTIAIKIDIVFAHSIDILKIFIISKNKAEKILPSVKYQLFIYVS